MIETLIIIVFAVIIVVQTNTKEKLTWLLRLEKQSLEALRHRLRLAEECIEDLKCQLQTVKK